ncbi:MAG: SAM-dependent methyltransferase, partial [Acidobacteriota bacterium]|nr:SAM-dependent methyltransferase [Acidobacteriota bacterium]
EICRCDSVADMIESISHTSDLTERLRERIMREGPMTFYDWMRLALYDVREGYYCRNDRQRWGREGDYRTSPERSSLFAATFARYFASLYDNLGKPSHWTIAEAGAGDGYFAAGVLQTLKNCFPQIFSATNYVMDEVSSHSRSLAWEHLQPFADRREFRKLGELEIDFGVVFSNELLDAFPVHRVKMNNGRLREFYVTVGANGKFDWTLGPLSTPRLNYYFAGCAIQLAESQVAEVNLEIEGWFMKVAERLRTGYIVTVDYGANADELYASHDPHARHRLDVGTLRSFHRHRIVNDVLARPGEQDLTTTVDWSFVKRVGGKLGFEVIEFERLDKFLLNTGLIEQLESESQSCGSEAEKLRLSTAAREMILPDGMAASFQVFVQKKCYEAGSEGANGG